MQEVQKPSTLERLKSISIVSLISWVMLYPSVSKKLIIAAFKIRIVFYIIFVVIRSSYFPALLIYILQFGFLR
jgi:hypothetical protein